VLTERSGRINLGLEGTLVFGAMSGYAVAVVTGIGLGRGSGGGAGGGGVRAGAWLICSIPRVNDIAIGIAMMLFGTGLAFFFGKPFIQPVAPDLPSIPFGWWSDVPQVQAALNVNVLFLIGIGLAIAAWVDVPLDPPGLIIRVVGDSTDAARAMGLRPMR
jgi:general nucleoside transport system permease protein